MHQQRADSIKPLTNLDLAIQWIGCRPNPSTGTGYNQRGQSVKI
jgi:hypothetical protein